MPFHRQAIFYERFKGMIIMPKDEKPPRFWYFCCPRYSHWISLSRLRQFCSVGCPRDKKWSFVNPIRLIWSSPRMVQQWWYFWRPSQSSKVYIGISVWVKVGQDQRFEFSLNKSILTMTRHGAWGLRAAYWGVSKPRGTGRGLGSRSSNGFQAAKNVSLKLPGRFKGGPFEWQIAIYSYCNPNN